MLINVLENMLNQNKVIYVIVIVDIILLIDINIVQQNVQKNMNILFQNLDNIVSKIVKMNKHII